MLLKFFIKILLFFICYRTEKDELPRLLVVITGKGPLHDDYVAKFSKFHSSYVQIVTTWLTAEDYPKMLSSADLGVSLHTSSSGYILTFKNFYFYFYLRIGPANESC